ncbi:unnamed protein product, partial [Mesorhabditis spiculigera]
MDAVPSCGCKGVRFCALCEDTEREAGCAEPTGDQLSIGGLLLIHNFISKEEEARLMETINKVDWAPSQSGRRKQDYGPKVNFKHKKVKTTGFTGMPEYADFLLNKMSAYSEQRLGHYLPFEMCNLEYEPEKHSAIEFHQDDMWIWGNRLISINLLSGSVMSLANKEKRLLCFVPMPHLSLLCMADEVRYEWKHAVLYQHITSRRIALTMREADLKFTEGGELYEKFGQELITIARQRVLPPA